MVYFIAIPVALFILFAGRILQVDQQPVKSDVIIVLGGGNTGERELKASQLFKESYAPYVIISNGGSRSRPTTAYAEREIGWLREYGVPDSAIIPELEAQSTYGNAVFTKQLMEKFNFQSAIVVSSSYHMRRTQYIFNKEYEHSGKKLTYVAAQVPNYSPDSWWSTRSGWSYITSEYKKLIGYWIVYGILNNKDLYN